ncbi:MAG: ATP synthase F1 subunit delta [Ruminococcaceae bacterium]|nr:ATP synthase F1 subunit delta [Oscillospiraceae bacterium]
MNETSREYGAGLFALAEEYGIEEEILENINVLSEYFTDEYIHILLNPGIPKNERIGLVRELLDGKFNEYVVNYVMLMTERGRASSIKESFAEYEKLYLEKFAVVKVKAESAYPLTDSQKEKLEEKLKKLTGRRPILEYVLNPSLIGGMRLAYDNRSIDDSVQTKLKEIGAVLADTTV